MKTVALREFQRHMHQYLEDGEEIIVESKGVVKGRWTPGEYIGEIKRLPTPFNIPGLVMGTQNLGRVDRVTGEIVEKNPEPIVDLCEKCKRNPVYGTYVDWSDDPDGKVYKLCKLHGVGLQVFKNDIINYD